MGWTQEKLAEQTRISRAFLANIENGKYNPSLEVALRIAAKLGKSVDDLFL